MRTKIIMPVLLLFFCVYSNGCILEEFDTVPINIPVAIPVYLVDPGTQDSIMSDAGFCLDSNKVYIDNKGKIQKVTLVEVAFRFSSVTPAGVQGDMKFFLREVDSSGTILIDQHVNDFKPGLYLIQNNNTPFVLDLSDSQLELMNRFLAHSGTCFYGKVVVENLSPAGTPKMLVGFVDMLFKAETKF